MILVLLEPAFLFFVLTSGRPLPVTTFFVFSKPLCSHFAAQIVIREFSAPLQKRCLSLSKGFPLQPKFVTAAAQRFYSSFVALLEASCSFRTGTFTWLGWPHKMAVPSPEGVAKIVSPISTLYSSTQIKCIFLKKKSCLTKIWHFQQCRHAITLTPVHPLIIYPKHWLTGCKQGLKVYATANFLKILCSKHSFFALFTGWKMLHRLRFIVLIPYLY